MSPKILALDTSTEACSAALLFDKKIIERYELAPRQHTTLILPMLQALLDEAHLQLEQLDAIAFGCGPGSFTGVRIATSIVQSTAFAADLPVIPVSTLQALAQGAYHMRGAHVALAAIDARMEEIYWGMYELNERNIMVARQPEQLCSPNSVDWTDIQQNCTGIGSGWDTYHTILAEKAGRSLDSWLPHHYPKASDVLAIAIEHYKQGKTVTAEQALPVYLRDHVATKKL